MHLFEVFIIYFITILIIIFSYNNANDELPTNWIDELYSFYDNHVNTNLITSIVISPIVFKPLLYYLKFSFELQNILQKTLHSSNKYTNIFVLQLRTVLLFIALYIFFTINQKMISIVFNFSNNANVTHESIVYLIVFVIISFVFFQLMKWIIRRKNTLNK